MRVLAGDIGGTKTLLQLADYVDGTWHLILQERYASRAYNDLETLLSEFCASASGNFAEIDSVCLAVAGVVTEGEVQLTNISWSTSVDRLRSLLGIAQVQLINDLEGAAFGIECVEPSDLLVLHVGDPVPYGVRALIGAGTGLGEAWMAWSGEGYEVHAGEGGHVDFAPRDALEIDLLVYLKGLLGRVSYEHVLSGAGLKRIFDFLIDRGISATSPELMHDFAHGDPAAVICDHALRHETPLAQRALECYVSIYGARAANLVLTVGARGGVYVVGGIAPKISGALRRGGFMAAFFDNPAMADLLKRVPVTVVLDSDVTLLGARAAALRCSIN